MTRKNFRKSTGDKSIYGVCGGIAEFFGISPFLIRLLFVMTIPVSLVVYALLANVMEDGPRTIA